jgi:hypothetical protein
MSDRTQSWQRQLVPCVIITVVLMAGFGSMPFSAGKTTTFGFACASRNVVLPPAVKQVVSGISAKNGDDHAAIYGDRAVLLKLRGGSEMTYFVPMSCDGWGNCKWAIVAPSPLRNLGVVAGEIFIVETARGAWPEIHAFSTTRSDQADNLQGAEETLEFKDDGYHRKALIAIDPRVVAMLAACLEDKSCCPPAP